MQTTEILYEVADHVATITLNRPEKLNAWTQVMQHEVRAAMEAAGADSAVRVILVTGAGRGFCAGADLDKMKASLEAGRPGNADGLRKAPVRNWPNTVATPMAAPPMPIQAKPAPRYLAATGSMSNSFQVLILTGCDALLVRRMRFM